MQWKDCESFLEFIPKWFFKAIAGKILKPIQEPLFYITAHDYYFFDY